MLQHSRQFLRCIQNWLNGRKQRVVLNGSTSEWIDVESGCVQDSILGPVIALCLLDIVGNHVDYVSISKYADDYKFYAKVTKDEEHKRMQDEIDNIVN